MARLQGFCHGVDHIGRFVLWRPPFRTPQRQRTKATVVLGYLIQVGTQNDQSNAEHSGSALTGCCDRVEVPVSIGCSIASAEVVEEGNGHIAVEKTCH